MTSTKDIKPEVLLAYIVNYDYKVVGTIKPIDRLKAEHHLEIFFKDSYDEEFMFKFKSNIFRTKSRYSRLVIALHNYKLNRNTEYFFIQLEEIVSSITWQAVEI